MAAPELSLPARRRPRLPGGLGGAWLRAYGAIWIATLACAAIVAALGAPMTVPAHRLLALRLSASVNPPPALAHVLALWGHNVPIAAWPLLLGVLGAQRHSPPRRVADIAVLASLAANVLAVGLALGAYGPRLLPYLPQLPLEWAGLALGASAWLTSRRRALRLKEALTVLLLLTAALAGAATLETLAVPHRQRLGERAAPAQAAQRERAENATDVTNKAANCERFAYPPPLEHSSTGQG